MEKQALKDFIFGGLTELMNDSKYYHYSRIGIDYCHWTEAGVKALTEYTNFIGTMMIRAQEEDLDQRAKEMVLEGLKS